METIRWLCKKVRSAIDRSWAHLVAWRYRKHALPSVSIDSVAGAGVDDFSYSPVLEDICLPPHGGAEDHDDLTPLLRIVDSTEPDLVVEFGTGYGNLAANVCAVSEDTHVLTVDAPEGLQAGTLTTYQLPEEDIGRVYRQRGFEERVTQLYENTLDLDISGHLQGREIDLAVIDACHDTEYVLNDFLELKDHVAGDGIVLLHDTQPGARGHLVGSYAACLKLRADGFDIRHIEGTWWGIWSPAWDEEGSR